MHEYFSLYLFILPVQLIYVHICLYSFFPTNVSACNCTYMHVNICICMYMLVSSCITCFNTVQINSFITSMPRGGFYTRFKRWVLHQVPSAHCKILLPALSTFHSSRRALRHWCIRAMCWSAVPCGPCSGHPAQQLFSC